MTTQQHILYSFRRCPYAMRARMALKVAEIDYEHREISLKDKPQHMLKISPKGTVPVLQLRDGTVLEESLDIMHWALSQNGPQPRLQDIEQLIEENDQSFKRALDRYKYPERFGEPSGEPWRQQGEVFLQKLEDRLQEQTFLFSERPNLADLAIFPFVRQFAHVDWDWFQDAGYPKLLQWYQYWAESELFFSVMDRHAVWEG